LGCPIELADVADDIVQRGAAVPPLQRERETGARRGERVEAERGEDARRAQVPGVRDHERLALVQRPERLRLPLLPRHALRSSTRCGAPYSSRSARNGTASNASGPSTPAPSQTPSARSSSATTGLSAVCQTTAWAPSRTIDSSLSTSW